MSCLAQVHKTKVPSLTSIPKEAEVVCETTRDRLRSELGGLAIEMEGGAVAQVCEAFGIPWLVIRALSDLAGGDALFDFTAFVDQAAESSATILRRLLPVL